MLSELFFSMVVSCCIGSVVCVILRVALCWKKQQKYDPVKEVPIVLFVGYCVGLFSMTIPVYSIIRHLNETIDGVFRSVNLIPFKTISGYIRQSNSMAGISLTNLLGNVLLFIPMGILLPIVFKSCNSLLKSVIIGTVISVLIETAQFFLGRSADIDDVILNALGTALGFAVYYAAKKLFKTIAL